MSSEDRFYYSEVSSDDRFYYIEVSSEDRFDCIKKHVKIPKYPGTQIIYQEIKIVLQTQMFPTRLPQIPNTQIWDNKTYLKLSICLS